MPESKFIFVTGGRRSGKSAYSLDLAESTGKKRLYIATAEALDEEMKARITRHREERAERWETAEEPLDVAGALARAGDFDVILIDCLTLWLCNIMHKDAPDDEKIINMIDDLAEACRESSVPVITVTNELGLGVIPGDPLSRRFTDLAGIMNQRMAAAADLVVMTISGIPLTIKGK